MSSLVAPELSDNAASAPPPRPAPPSLWSRAVQRRVPQILGLYVGSATSAVLFAEFLTKRYALSPYLVDALLLALVLAVPAVVALAFWHGESGSQRWTRRQGVVLSCNAVGALAVLAFAFWGKPLGATTETVTVETADGGTVEREVAKAAFRKRVVVSDFEGDEALGRTAGYALAQDLQQDLFVTAYSAGALRRNLREAGFDGASGAPLALLREAAADNRVDRLVTGRVERTDRGFHVEAELHTVSGPSRPERYTLDGPSLPRLLDDLSVRIRADLGLPETHLAESDDRPIEDLLSGSTDALVAWAAGLHAVQFLDDNEVALRHLETAVAADSTFARANLDRGNVLNTFARQAEAQRAYAAAQRHHYRLPEAGQFALNSTIALFEQRPDDARAIAREWAALYPDDVSALVNLAGLLQQADDAEGAIEVSRRLVKLDSGNPVRRYSLGVLYYNEERYDEARRELDAYIAAEPDDPDGYAMLASVLVASGDIEAALEANRQAVRLDPNDARYSLYLGGNLMRAGEWEEAEATFRRGEARAAEPSDKVGALNALAHLYDARGQYREAAETLDEMWPVAATYTPPVRIVVGQLGEGYHYTRAGRTAEFEQTLQRALAQPEVEESDAYRASISAAAAWAYAQTGRTAEVLRYTAAADSLYRAYGYEVGLPYVHAIRGIGYANRKDWPRAIRSLLPHSRKSPNDFYRVMPLAEAYLAVGDGEKARAVAEGVLVAFPAHPGAHLLLAKLDRRRPAEARRHLRSALAAWSQADPGFRPAQEARALLGSLGGTRIPS